MKQFNIFSFLCIMLIGVSANAQDRYLEPITTNIAVDLDVQYGENVSVLTGAPASQPLFMDVYYPADDESNVLRPLVIYCHTGNFLPTPTNGGPQGNKNDSSVVFIAERLASMGYVVASIDYRLGWNPFGDLDTRIGTLINAAYRGVQDLNTAVRYFRKEAAVNNNPLQIDTDKIMVWGQGTGGYITFAASTLDSYEDIYMDQAGNPNNKFRNADGSRMVTEALNGNPFGTTNTPLCIANWPEYSSEFNLAVNMGGALGDTLWVDADDIPMISAHVPRDPFAPYDYDILTVPTTGDLIIDVAGSFRAQQIAAELGLNDVFASKTLTDEFTMVADSRNEGLDGLFPTPRPTTFSPLTMEDEPESGPWDFWDSNIFSMFPHPSCPEGAPLSVCNFDLINRINNPDMSKEKALNYIDSIVGYVAPRACLALELGCNLVSNSEVLASSEVLRSASPNPAHDFILFETQVETPLQAISLVDVSGRVVLSQQDINQVSFQLDVSTIPAGIYVARLQFEEGIIAEKFIIE